MYCNRLHAWWSTQSQLATLLSSLIACRWVGLNTLWRFQLKDLSSIDEMVGPDALAVCWAHRGLPVRFFCSCFQFYLLLSPYVCFISFFLSWFTCSGRWCIDKSGVFHANQISMCLGPHLNLGWGWCSETGLSPPVEYFTDRQRRYFFCGSFMFFLSCVCYPFVRVCLFVSCCHLLVKGRPLGSQLWCITVSLSLSHWYPGSGVVLDCIDSWSLLLTMFMSCFFHLLFSLFIILTWYLTLSISQLSFKK